MKTFLLHYGQVRRKKNVLILFTL